nr:hypothetical protein [uncultured Psychroserpens sp.]
MKTFKPILFFLLMTPFLFSFSCDDEDEEDEPDRKTVLVTLQNNAGDIGSGGCIPIENSLTFIVSYRDIQVDAAINGGSQGFINVLVEDGESINVIVQRTDSGILRSNSNVNVRTDSRPGPEDAPRRIIYCEAFELQFENF